MNNESRTTEFRRVNIDGEVYTVPEDVRLGELLYHRGGEHYLVDTSEKLDAVKELFKNNELNPTSGEH